MLTLYLEAPFATFRTFTAGWYRPTATFLTPSAAYGLILNVAGIETRLDEGDPAHDGSTPASLVKAGLPSLEVAIGAPTYRLVGRRRFEILESEVFPRIQSIFQQLHNYPVGSTGKERAEETKGNKYNITPVRREFLSSVRAVIQLRSEGDLLDRILRGLNGEQLGERYGVPFLGDNSFLLDRLETLAEPGLVRWYERVADSANPGPRERTTRLTVNIDRADLSRTESHLYAPASQPQSVPSEAAWIKVSPFGVSTPQPSHPKKTRRKTGG